MRQMIFPLDSHGMGLFEQCGVRGVMEYAPNTSYNVFSIYSVCVFL